LIASLTTAPEFIFKYDRYIISINF
jgi:hypothetical protein